MKLSDWLQPLGTERQPVGPPIRCHVGYTRSGTETRAAGSGEVRYLVEELRALIRPHPHAVYGSRWQWRGDTYVLDTAPLVRRRNGRDHHYTLQLRAIGEGVL